MHPSIPSRSISASRTAYNETATLRVQHQVARILLSNGRVFASPFAMVLGPGRSVVLGGRFWAKLRLVRQCHTRFHHEGLTSFMKQYRRGWWRDIGHLPIAVVLVWC